jgi:hypothetical protein
MGLMCCVLFRFRERGIVALFEVMRPVACCLPGLDGRRTKLPPCYGPDWICDYVDSCDSVDQKARPR